MQNEVRVGDVVFWEKVPPDALVQVVGGADDLGLPAAYAIRSGDGGKWVYDPDEVGRVIWSTAQATWRWTSALDAGVIPPSGECTIIALNLTGQETAADLQRLAEVYEVRVALQQLPPTMALVHVLDAARDDDGPWPWDKLAKRLRAAGWHPCMTAEDAARMLAEAGR